jgi:heme-degrading monooxygenase HmoA
MYARVVTINTKPGSMDEGINIYENSIVPAMHKQSGFKGTTFLTNKDTNTVVSISLWETEADMQAGEASGYLQTQFAKAAHLFAAPPANAHYEVRVQV